MMISSEVVVDEHRTETVDVLVIGAGQAGLAAGFHLLKSSARFLIVERSDHLGSSWRSRYNSLTLFTPRSLSSLPDLRLEGDPSGYATRDEFASYLKKYADHLKLPVRLGNGVKCLTRNSDGRFRALFEAGDEIISTAVIVATGAFQNAVVPPISSDLDSSVAQFTTETYRSPGEVPRGGILVVGDGASGRDIAVELAGSHRVILSTGNRGGFSRKGYSARAHGGG